MQTVSKTKKVAFTLVELVVTVVIVGLLASMAIPRIATGSDSAREAALSQDLMIVRNAINRYAAEHHNQFPPASTNVEFHKLMLQYSDLNGNTRVSRNTDARYGPYLHAVPAVPVGRFEGSTKVKIDTSNSPPQADGSTLAGWLYNPNTGEFYANDATVNQYGVVLPGTGFDADLEADVLTNRQGNDIISVGIR